MISKELSLIGGSSFAQAREENRSHKAVVRPGGAATEAIRRDRVKSSWGPLAALGAISPWNPLATLSFHKENSAIAEGLVPLRVPGLD